MSMLQWRSLMFLLLATSYATRLKRRRAPGKLANAASRVIRLQVYATKALSLENEAGQKLQIKCGDKFYSLGTSEGKATITSSFPSDESPQWKIDEGDIAPVHIDCPSSFYGEWRPVDVCKNAEYFGKWLAEDFVQECVGMQQMERVRAEAANSLCPEKQFQYSLCQLEGPGEDQSYDLNGTGEWLANRIWPDLASMSVGAYSTSIDWPYFPPFKAPPTTPVSPQQGDKVITIHKYAREMKTLSRMTKKIPITNKACKAGVRWLWLGELCHFISDDTSQINELGVHGAGEGSDCASIFKHRKTGVVAIAFRGTDGGRDWQFDTDFRVAVEFHGYMVPRGFSRYYKSFESSTWVSGGESMPQSFAKVGLIENPADTGESPWKLWLQLARAAPQVWITGHSLGGAAATLHMLELQATGVCPPIGHAQESKCGIVTFGTPMLFEKEWAGRRHRGNEAQCVCSDFARCARIWRETDGVSRSPPKLPGGAHYVHGKLHSLKVSPKGDQFVLEQVRDKPNHCTCHSKPAGFGLSNIKKAHSIKSYSEDLWRRFVTNRSSFSVGTCEEKHWSA